MRIRSVLKHSTMAVLEGALVASLVVGLMAGTALAGKPGGGGGGGGGGGHHGGGSTTTTYTGTVSLELLNGATAAVYGGQVTFNVTSNAPYYFVEAKCSQASTVVYQQV